MRNGNILAFAFILILVCTLIGTGGPVSESFDTSEVQSSLAQRVEHDPILIDGNADLLSQKSTNNWTGTGEPHSPVTIANYRIEFSHVGIYIRNVDLHFTIINCETGDYDTEYYLSTGIKLVNCSNGDISDSLAHMKETGIHIIDSSHITIDESTVHDCFAGISVAESSFITVYNNNFGWNDFVGVNVSVSDHCSVSGNSILSIPTHGIICCVDTSTHIFDNVITSTYMDDDEFEHVGIFSYHSENLVVERTNISNCAIGVEMQASSGAYVVDCIVNTTEYGIYLHEDTSNVSIVMNHLCAYEGFTAYDGGSGNLWDDSYSEIGNYWSDYSGSGYYYISGPAESIDHFPNLFNCSCSGANSTLTGTITTTTNFTTISNDTGLGEGVPPLVLVIALGSSTIILIAVVLIFRSNKSY